ncbi:hypothetical protein STEG23_037232 [Scotinomys teguina]
MHADMVLEKKLRVLHLYLQNQDPAIVLNSGTRASKGQQLLGLDKDTTKTANLTKKRAAQKRPRSRSSSIAQRSIVGCRIAHQWKAKDGLISEWIGTVLYEVPVKPSLYMVKYDGVDCVYALELCKDERILCLTLLSGTVEPAQASDPSLADDIIGKQVEHLFEGKCGSMDKWKGLVLTQVPNWNGWFYISYEKDPILFMYQLGDDYKEGNLQIIPEFNDTPPLEVDMELVDGLIGTRVQYTKDDDPKRTDFFTNVRDNGDEREDADDGDNGDDGDDRNGDDRYGDRETEIETERVESVEKEEATMEIEKKTDRERDKLEKEEMEMEETEKETEERRRKMKR